MGFGDDSGGNGVDEDRTSERGFNNGDESGDVIDKVGGRKRGVSDGGRSRGSDGLDGDGEGIAGRVCDGTRGAW